MLRETPPFGAARTIPLVWPAEADAGGGAYTGGGGAGIGSIGAGAVGGGASTISRPSGALAHPLSTVANALAASIEFRSVPVRAIICSI